MSWHVLPRSIVGGAAVALAVVFMAGHLGPRPLDAQGRRGPSRPWSCWVASQSSAVFQDIVTDPACRAFTTSTTRIDLLSPAGRARPVAPPRVPSGLKAAAVGRTIVLDWQSPAGFDEDTTYVVDAGSAPGRSDLAAAIMGGDAPGLIATDVPPGTYVFHVRARNRAGISGPSNEAIVTLPADCATVPAAPTSLAATVTGSAVTLTWQAPSTGCAATAYLIEAGSSSGSSNLASVPTGTTATTFSATAVPSGTYFVRVRAANPAGTSPASNEVSFTIGATACTSAPSVPSGLTATASGSAVSLTWSPPSGGCPLTAYFLEAGSAPGFSDLAATSTGSASPAFSTTGVGNGIYYVRVRALNANGQSGASNEVQLIVGPSSTGFKPGVYYRLPGLDTPAARLMRLGDAPDQVVPQVPQMPPPGWDMCRDSLIYPTPTGLTLVSTSGEQRAITITSIFRIARPSLSADCRYAAVQASATAVTSPEDLNIYVIDLQNGAVTRISFLDINEESPRFFPAGHRLAYSSFSPTEGVNLHVYDLDQQREVGLLKDIGALQIAITPNGTQFIDPRRMRIYRLDTGAVVTDLLDRATASIKAAGAQLDQRFNDPANGFVDRGFYPLDAAFSPSGQQLVLDWAVQSGGAYGNLLVTMSVASSDFAVVTALIPTNPQFTNSNNYSQLNPEWK